MASKVNKQNIQPRTFTSNMARRGVSYSQAVKEQDTMPVNTEQNEHPSMMQLMQNMMDMMNKMCARLERLEAKSTGVTLKRNN